MAGLVKGYARLVEVHDEGQPSTEVRDGRIDRNIWRRIVAEDKIAAVYEERSVHLGERGAAGHVSVIGIRFDAVSVQAAAADHGAVAKAPVAPAAVKNSKPRAVAPSSQDEGRSPQAEDAPEQPVKRRTTLERGTVALSKAEIADVLGVSMGTVNNLIKRSEIEVKRIGRRTLVQAESVRAFMQLGGLRSDRS